MGAIFNNLVTIDGVLWLAALGAAFVAMVVESARPKAEEGKHDSLTLPRFLAMVCGTLTPFFLFAHTIGAGIEEGHSGPVNLVLDALAAHNFTHGAGAAILAGVGLLIVAVIIASTIGLVIGSTAPGLGRALQTIAPFLSIAAFAFTFYVTWRLAWGLIDFFILRHGL